MDVLIKIHSSRHARIGSRKTLFVGLISLISPVGGHSTIGYLEPNRVRETDAISVRRCQPNRQQSTCLGEAVHEDTFNRKA